MPDKTERRSGYPLVERLCSPCGKTKKFARRNKYCSPQCASSAARNPTRELVEPREGFASSVRRPKPSHPTGWEPRVEEYGNTAVAISQPTDKEDLEERDLIIGWKMDPDVWRIDGPVGVRRWQVLTPVDGINDPEIDESLSNPDRWWVERTGGDCQCDTLNPNFHYEQRWNYYYKANLVRRTADEDSTSYDEFVRLISKRKPVTKQDVGEDEVAFIVCLADLQMGKDDGDGVEGTIQRFKEAIPAITKRIKDLRRAGRNLGTLYLFGMGDLIENCDGFYAQQTFRVKLNRRDQVKVVRRLVVEALVEWAPLFPKVVVSAVGGNHGENRKDGKSYTDFADNDDVAIFEQVEEILAMNPDTYGHVRFKLPNNELSLTFDIYGTLYAITHGQVAGKGGGSSSSQQQKLHRWWRDQAHGMQPAGDAQVLLTAHYHHFSVLNPGRKTLIQCPALEGGSEWFKDMTGTQSYPGVLTLVAGAKADRYGRGWSDIEVC